MPPETALQKYESSYPVLSVPKEELLDIIRENLGQAGINVWDLDTIKVPTGGVTVFKVPTLEGQKMMEEIEGILIHVGRPRGYWSVSYAKSQGGSPPDCSSADGLTGEGLPGGNCLSCPLAKFGTKQNDDGSMADGQACRDSRLLFLVRPGSILPIKIAAPPTSIKAVQQYITQLTSIGRRFYGVLTKVALITDKAGNIEYSKLKLTTDASLPPEMVPQLKAIREVLTPHLEMIPIRRSDVETSGE